MPAVDATVRGHQGMVVIMRFLKLRGPFCRTCGIAAHRDMTSKSLWQGWWGIGSMIINPITMLLNLPQRAKINKLPPPLPGAPGMPMNPGRPIFARPGSWVLVLPVALLALIVLGAGLDLADEPSSASVGDCMHNSGSGFNPDMHIVDCGSTQAEFRVVGKIDDATDIQRCEKFADQGARSGYYQQQGSSKFVLCLAPNK
ncbi:hypothetical protein LO771_07125 [Streptacidiphilus sp. ASG 303]|uniref:LppU/SCO3897 family protein n=1 Tax=Streptacidiphilus sp. ASG 303 TaxID=2896847 RepID=UPI001E6349FF|nr:hypothetical protein [Streptacidiphilus sp. ASG 303]MCD0482190.1 hypothetical protein [Streptacidiphilus sp. ASG 303]